MGHPYFDINTIYLYLIVGFICIFSVKYAKDGEYNETKERRGLWLMFITLIAFAVFRKVAYRIGGVDALGIENRFVNLDSIGLGRFTHTDVLFGKYLVALHYISNSVIFYRAVSYGIIVYGYVYYIKNICPRDISPLPFIAILIPYMRSLNTMRSSVAIAFILFGLVTYYNRKYIWSVSWFILACFMHRVSIVFLPLIPFLFIYDYYFSDLTKTRYFVILSVSIFISFLIGETIQNYVVDTQLFRGDETSDYYYLTMNRGQRAIERVSMYLPHLLLYCALFLKYNDIPKTNVTKFLIAIFSFDIIMLPISLILGMWRFFEFLFLPDLILWGVLIPLFYKDEEPIYNLAVGCCVLFAFSSFMVIRLLHDYQAAGLMPYLFIWQ